MNQPPTQSTGAVIEESQAEKAPAKDDKSFWKLLLVTIVAVVLADGLATWIPGVLAAGITVFSVGLIFYWIPPRPKMTYGRWFFHLVKYAALALIALTVYKLLGKTLRSIGWF